MRLLVGTSGFSYAFWRGLFYPERLPASRMLAFYASRFPTVEINNTFYRLPKAELLGRWAAEVPPEFVFCLKAPGQITHQARLRGTEDLLSRLSAATATLGDQLGAVLFQLPPSLKADSALLADFLSLLPHAMRAAFEFRHQSWFSDPVLGLLHERGHALCIAETESMDPHVAATSDWGYVRLRRTDYDERQLETWMGKLQRLGWSKAYVFLKHAEKAPLLAGRLIAMERALQTSPRVP